jgi:enoyl-CoA hydratase
MSTPLPANEEAVLLIDRLPSHWTFTINRPGKMNALSADLVEALIEGIDAAHQQHVPVLVFKGAGKNFSAGFDFTGLDDHSEGDLVLRFVRLEVLLQKLAASPAITVGFAHGRNFGAGVDLFAVCKRRVCTEDASFRMPGLKFGLVLGTRRFSAIVGKETAAAILSSASSFDATRAQHIHFVHALKPQQEWDLEVSDAQSVAAVLDAETRASLYRVLDQNHYDADLAELVRSASKPGLKDRIHHYLKG